MLLLNKPATTTIKYWNLYNDVNATHAVIGRCPWSIDRFQSRGQQLYKLLGIKESFNMWKEFNSHRIFFVHKHGRRFIVLHTNMAAVTSCENDLLEYRYMDEEMIMRKLVFFVLFNMASESLENYLARRNGDKKSSLKLENA